MQISQQHDWLLDVLNDLRLYTNSNRLTAVDEQLKDTILTLSVEIASLQPSSPLLPPLPREEAQSCGQFDVLLGWQT